MNKKKGRTLVLGHRGYRGKYPENTLLSVRKSFEYGADGIECDLQKTADGRYVIIHDCTTDRVSGKSGSVALMNYADLKSLEVGQGETIPGLTDLLNDFPEAGFLNLELKTETLSAADGPRIHEILAGRLDRDNLLISSFGPDLLKPFRKLGYGIGLLIGEEAAARGMLHLFFRVLQVRPRFLNLPVDMFRLLSPKKAARIIRLFRGFGFSLAFWTVNTVEEAYLIKDWADVIITDEVEVIIRAVGVGEGAPEG